MTSKILRFGFILAQIFIRNVRPFTTQLNPIEGGIVNPDGVTE